MNDMRAFAKPDWSRDQEPAADGREWRHSVPAAIIACMIEDRPPNDAETELVASHIWCGMRAGRTTRDWAAVSAGGAAHRRMIAAALAALGAAPATPPSTTIQHLHFVS